MGILNTHKNNDTIKPKQYKEQQNYVHNQCGLEPKGLLYFKCLICWIKIVTASVCGTNVITVALDF